MRRPTLKGFLDKIGKQYGRAKRVWVMDRGITTEEQLKEMREAVSPVAYLVGTPRGRLSKLEKQFLERPWAKVKESVEVKLLPREGELYILTGSEGRRQKARAMRRRRLKHLWHDGAGLASSGPWPDSWSRAGEDVRYSNGGDASAHDR